MAETTIAPRKRRARNLAIASLVIAILMVLSCALMTYLFVAGAGNIMADPSILDGVDDGYADIGIMFGGTTLTKVEGYYAFCVLLAVFFGFGTALNLIPLMASVRAIRVVKRENNTRTPYILAAMGAAVSFVTLNPVNGILLIFIAMNLQSDYVDTVGEKVAYKDGKRLGPLRFFEFLCLFDLVVTTGLVIFITKSDYNSVFNVFFWVDFVKLLMEAVALWFVWNRKQHGREVIMVMVTIYLIIRAIVTAVVGDVTIEDFVLETCIPIMLLIYFGFSRRARDIFTEPFKTINREKQLAEDEKLWNPKSWRFWRNLLLYFCIFSVIGHWMEWCVCWIIRIAVDNGITILGTYDPNSGIWSNMLNPFFVYGMALVLIGLVLFPMRNLFYRKISNKYAAFIASFIFNMILIAVLELVIGLTQNLDYSLWDYRTMPLNFMGQICITNTTFFTIMATLFTNLVYPNLEKIFAKLPDDVMNVLTVVVIVFFALVVSMYVAPGVQDLSTDVKDILDY